MVVVAIVVAYFTAGAATGLVASALNGMGVATATTAAVGAGAAAAGAATIGGTIASIGGAALAAAAGSIVSQGVGIAIGAQEKFSWGAVGKAFIGGAVGGALFGTQAVAGFKATEGLLGGTGNWVSTASQSFGRAAPYVQAGLNSAIANVLTQGISVAVGLQEKFSWREVAASAAGGAVGAGATKLIGKSLTNTLGPVPGKIVGDTVSGFASGVAQSVVRGGKIDLVNIAADAFGNALGNGIVSSLSKWNSDQLAKKVRGRIAAETPEAVGLYDDFVRNGGNPSSFLKMMKDEPVRDAMSRLGLLKSKGADIEKATSAGEVWQSTLEGNGNIESILLGGQTNNLKNGRTFGAATLQGIADLQSGLGNLTKDIPFEDAMMALQVAAMGPGAYVLDWAKGQVADKLFGKYLSAGVKMASTAFTAAAHDTSPSTVEKFLDANAVENEYTSYFDKYEADPSAKNLAALNLAQEQRETVLNVQGEVMKSEMGGGTLATILLMGVSALKKGPQGPYRGGAHRDMRKPVGDGLDSNHMPADSISPIPREDGPAIQMDPLDHRETSSWGSSTEAIEYRNDLKAMIDDGKMRDAMATEIRDVRRVARDFAEQPRKYNEAMREMLDYAKKAGYLDKPGP
jgi:hypothetical protein